MKSPTPCEAPFTEGETYLRKRLVPDRGETPERPKSETAVAEEKRRRYVLEGIAAAPVAGKMAKRELEDLLVKDILDAEDAARLEYRPDEMAELRDSIVELGLLDPISVFPYRGKYQVLDGQRRLITVRELGWHTVACYVYPAENLAIEAIRLHQNQVHATMSPWEESIYFTRMCDRVGLTFEELCKFVRKSESYVSDRLLLQQAQPETQEALKNGLITLGVAKELRRLKDRKWELYYLDQCLRSGTGTQVLHGWISAHIQRGGLEVRTVSTEPAQVVATPPPIQQITCFFCGGESGGRQLTNVWVHSDELATVQRIVEQIKAQFATVDTDEAPPAPEGK